MVSLMDPKECDLHQFNILRRHSALNEEGEMPSDKDIYVVRLQSKESKGSNGCETIRKRRFP